MFSEALDMIGKGVPSGWIEENGSYWSTSNFRFGKEFMIANVNGLIVEQVMVICAFANNADQYRWLKESYDTLIADNWELILDDDDTWAFMKEDKLATGVSDDNDGTPMASVVFIQR